MGGDDVLDARRDGALGDCWDAWRTGPLRLSSPRLLIELSSPMLEGDPWLSPDALTLYFGRANPMTGDFFAVVRPDRDSPFGAPAAITELNTAADETKLSMTADGLIVVWSSDRMGSQGWDLWEATRGASNQPFGTATQTRLAQLNDNLEQFDPHISMDGLRLYYAPLSGPNQFIELSTRATTTDSFSAPLAVTDLGTNRNGDPALSPDELVIVYSARQTATDPLTLWYAARTSSAVPFSNPRRLPDINDGTLHDQDPALSFDGCELFFRSRRAGDESELYVSAVQ
jgi:hypothetical protein